MSVIKSRAATLAEVGIPDPPKRCPACGRKIGTRFVALYAGSMPGQKLVGWRCSRCHTEFPVAVA